MEKSREPLSQTMIIALIGAAVLGVLLVLYFTVLKPKQEADRALADFNSPEAQAKRDPDQRKVDPNFAKTIEQIKAKEQHATFATGVGRAGRRDRN